MDESKIAMKGTMNMIFLSYNADGFEFDRSYCNGIDVDGMQDALEQFKKEYEKELNKRLV